MAKGYWIVHEDIHDMETFKTYMAKNGAAIAAFGGRFVIRGGDFTVAEGATRGRHAVVEFPTYQAAIDCYNSADYQDASESRKVSSECDFLIFEGYDGPQPGDS